MHTKKQLKHSGSRDRVSGTRRSSGPLTTVANDSVRNVTY